MKALAAVIGSLVVVACTPAPPARTEVDVPQPTDASAPPVASAEREAAFAERAKKEFGERCEVKASCGDLRAVDCGAAVDGPLFYVNVDTFATVAKCGGFCMRQACTDCPPKAWTCPTH